MLGWLIVRFRVSEVEENSCSTAEESNDSTSNCVNNVAGMRSDRYFNELENETCNGITGIVHRERFRVVVEFKTKHTLAMSIY